MKRLVISFLLIALSSERININSAVVVPGEGQLQLQMKSIGEYSHPMSILKNADGQDKIQRTSYYFLSQNAAGWATAEMDCKSQLGMDATLLYIETEEELKTVISYVESSDDTGSTYWTGGKYDTESENFVWANGVEFGVFLPWDVGYPDSYALVTRVSAYTVGEFKLRTQFQTVSNRYICELQVTRHLS